MDDKTNIMVSHSGWPHNNHIQSFDLLKRFRGRVRITCPLCYGDNAYIDKVIMVGKKYFGEDFVYFTDLLPLKEYSKLHQTMDIYVSSASVQTGLGAIFCAMESGSKIFLKDNLYQSLSSLSYKINHVDDLNDISYEELVYPIAYDDALYNVEIRNRQLAEGGEAFCKWRDIYRE
jgi:hypothetical protein